MGESSVGVNCILQGDCIERMNALPPGSVDLAFADPPFNIGYDYDVYNDKQEAHAYLEWSRRWIAAVHRVLSPTGTFWLAIGDEYAAELKVLSQQVGFTCRSWVVWYYTFGVNCKHKFSRSHAHLFYFVKDPARFTFRSDALENRIPSARQLVYADSRANPTGRLPDDTWVLRPQDLADCFTTAEDTWYFPRVAGTFKERAGFHGCQMPEQLLGRIVRCCSEPDHLVLDPFSGSATTVAVAKKLGRRYVAFDLSEEYVTRGTARLESIRRGDPLEGAAEPTMSAPATARGKGSPSQAKRTLPGTSAPEMLPAADAALLHEGLVEAYRRAHDGFSLDRLVADPAMNARLADICQELGLPGEARSWNGMLFRLRKAGQLAAYPTQNRTEFSWAKREDYIFASEIAWRTMIDQGCDSLDTILCDPFLAEEFDQIAARWAPGHAPLEYRWAAITLRKNAKFVRARAQLLTDARFGNQIDLDHRSAAPLPESPAVYVVAGAGKKAAIFAGETSNLRLRIQNQFGEATQPLWKDLSGTLSVRYFRTSCVNSDRMAYQRRAVARHAPILNLHDPKLV